MENSKFKCGIIGTGSFAEVHSQAAEENSATTLAGVCDIDPQRSGDFALKWNSQSYGSVTDLLSDTEPDIVAICSPDETHAGIAKEVIEHTNAPRVLIIEKPLCTSTEQLNMLASLPQDKTRIVVDHSRRFNSAHQKLKKMIENNELGTELISAGSTRVYMRLILLGCSWVIFHMYIPRRLRSIDFRRTPYLTLSFSRKSSPESESIWEECPKSHT